VLEKNGNEVVGAVVMMRHGENPLVVTKRIKGKIQELQAGLPEGVRIVPFYDRTRLIRGAIGTLTEVLVHEMLIASAAIPLILMHFRSAVLICMTLPLAVLVSFILMRHGDGTGHHHARVPARSAPEARRAGEDRIARGTPTCGD
jgi:Cu(I)/Ag(I) efflux system membrane protein CusA/SilA